MLVRATSLNHKNRSTKSRLVACGQISGWTNRIIIVPVNLADAPNNLSSALGAPLIDIIFSRSLSQPWQPGFEVIINKQTYCFP